MATYFEQDSRVWLISREDTRYYETVKLKVPSLLDQHIFLFQNLIDYLGQFLRLKVLQAVQVPISFLGQSSENVFLFCCHHCRTSGSYAYPRYQAKPNEFIGQTCLELYPATAGNCIKHARAGPPMTDNGSLLRRLLTAPYGVKFGVTRQGREIYCRFYCLFPTLPQEKPPISFVSQKLSAGAGCPDCEQICAKYTLLKHGSCHYKSCSD